MSQAEMTAVKEAPEVERLRQEPAELAAAAAATEAPIRTGAVTSQQSQLFTVRMWPEPLDGGQVEWRGKVDHVASGEGYYFRSWPRLIVYLEKMLQPGFRTGHGVG